MRLLVTWSLLLCLSSGCDRIKKLGRASEASGDSQVAYTLNGQDVSVADIKKDRPIAFHELERRQFQIIEEAARDSFIEDYFQAEGKKGGVSPENARRNYLNEQVKISKDDVEAFLKRVGKAEQFASLSPEERFAWAQSALLRNREFQVLQRLFETAKKDGSVKIVYQNPLEPVLKVSVTAKDAIRYNARLDGQPNYGCSGDECPVTIIEYVDFAKPDADRIYKTQTDVLNTFQGKVRWVSRQLPETYKMLSFEISRAAVCARELGRYWEFADVIYSHSKSLKHTAVKDYAVKAGLKEQDFLTCFNKVNASEMTLDAEISEAHRLGIRFAPSYLINGTVASGALQSEFLVKRVGDILGAGVKNAPQK
jgi:protein-disulfide isomerase